MLVELPEERLPCLSALPEEPHFPGGVLGGAAWGKGQFGHRPSGHVRCAADIAPEALWYGLLWYEQTATSDESRKGYLGHLSACTEDPLFSSSVSPAWPSLAAGGTSSTGSVFGRALWTSTDSWTQRWGRPLRTDLVTHSGDTTWRPIDNHKEARSGAET